MPYFVRSDGRVVVTIPGQPAPADAHPIEHSVGKALRLRHNTNMSPEDVGLVASQSWDTLLAELDDDHPSIASLPLPREGRWEYCARVVSELGGFATAEGTARRMEDAIEGLASEGWHVVAVVSRDARYIKGESVLIVFGRFAQTLEGFERRFEAEERIRRRVHARLDADVANSENVSAEPSAHRRRPDETER